MLRDSAASGRSPYADFLRQYVGPYRRMAALLCLVILCTIGLQLANPQILRWFIDTARSGGSLRSLTLVAALFLAVAIVTQVVSVLETYLAENLGWLATNRLRTDLALHCLRLDPDFHAAHTPGEMIERVDGDVTTLSNFFSRFIVYVLGNTLLLIGILVLLFRIDWRVGASVMVVLFAAAVLIHRIRDIAAPYWTAARQASAELYGFIEERLSGTEDIRSSGAAVYVLRRFFERSRQLLRSRLIATLAGMSLGWAIDIPVALATAIGVGIGTYLYQHGTVSIGTVYVIFAYGQMLNRPVEQLTRQFHDFQQAAGSIGRVQTLFGLRSALEDGPLGKLPPGPLSFEMENISFAYAGDEPVLNNISLYLAPGRVMGVLGRTGSGKTTMSRLLFRLYDPQTGTVRLGGIDLREARISAVRERIGIVTQDIQLFHATVRDNLTFFDRAIPDSRIQEVLQDLGLWEWVESLPLRLDTKLVAGATGLSAGEAQLLAFARVFLKDPGIVVLDEASSRLDPATERRLEHAVDRLLAGRTGIVIAHRLGTIRRVDDVLILEDGEIREWGPRAALERDPNSRFSEILRAGLEEVLA